MHRPAALELAPVMTEAARPKLSADARRNLLAELRCPKYRHLLAATVRTAWGPWVLARSGLSGPSWACWWWDAIAEPSTMRVWCRCHSWTVDLSDFTAPRLVR